MWQCWLAVWPLLLPGIPLQNEPQSILTDAAPERTYTVGAKPAAIVARDLDGDGVLDLVVANRGEAPTEEGGEVGHTVSVLLGAPDGSYAAAQDYEVGAGPSALCVGDFDADGRADVAVACCYATDGRDLALLRGKGDGTFAPATHFAVDDPSLQYAREPGLTALAAADVNEDGWTDLVAVGWTGGLVTVFLGDGRGGFGQQHTTRGLPVGPCDVAAADLDGDDHVDLVIAHHTAQRISLWRGDGTGRFQPVSQVPVPGPGPCKLEVGDVDADGHTDIVVGLRGPAEGVALLRGSGGLALRSAVLVSIQPEGNESVAEPQVRDVRLVDLDGDGLLDLAAAAFGGGFVSVLRGLEPTANGRPFAPPECHALTDRGPRALADGDLNRDGRADLAVACWSDGSVALLLASSPPGFEGFPHPKGPGRHEGLEELPGL